MHHTYVAGTFLNHRFQLPARGEWRKHWDLVQGGNGSNLCSVTQFPKQLSPVTVSHPVEKSPGATYLTGLVSE